MPTHAPTPPSTTGYSFVSYPTDYIFAHGNYGMPPQGLPLMPSSMSMPQMELPGVATSGHPAYPSPYATNMAYAHLGPMGQPTPSVSPMLAHSHLPPSPIMHNPHAPPSPPGSDRCSADTQAMRHLLTALTKMQCTMKDLAERQEQIFDRVSLLEQRVGRMDDGIGTLLEQSEVIVDNSKSIRVRVDEGESQDAQDAFENRLTTLFYGAFEKIVGGISDEIKDIKRLVKDTEKYVKSDPFTWGGRMAVGQRYRDALTLVEEAPKDIDDAV